MGCAFALYKDAILKKISSYWKNIFYISISLQLLLPLINGTIISGSANSILGGNHGTLANILIALIMMYSIFESKGIWFKFLNLKIINYIGLWSYSLYLYQQYFSPKIYSWTNNTKINIFINAGLILLTAVISYYFIEKPFIKLKSKFQTQPNSDPKLTEDVAFGHEN
jgi:peptidoglycan/LPS O-acetylase OafA/YrhL